MVENVVTYSRAKQQCYQLNFLIYYMRIHICNFYAMPEPAKKLLLLSRQDWITVTISRYKIYHSTELVLRKD